MKSIVLILLLVSLGNSGIFKVIGFKKTIKKIPSSQLQKQIDEFSTSKNLKNIAKEINLKKVAPLDKITIMAKYIANKSPFSDKMMSIKNPIDAIRIYSKGGDSFFKSSELITSKALSVDKQLIGNAGKQIPTFPNIPKLSQEQMLDRFVKVLKATGSFGFHVTKGLAKIAKDNPKSAVAGLMFAWFLNDPVGFKKQLDKFGGDVEDFARELGSLLSNTAVGGISGFIGGAIESAEKFMTPRNIFIFIVFFLLWLFWQFKSLVTLFIQDKFTKSNTTQSFKKKRKGRF